MKPDWPLRTERLVLRPYEAGDFDGLLELRGDPDVNRWLYTDPATPDDARAMLERNVASTELTEESGLSAAVTLPDGTYAGDVVLFRYSPVHRNAELGYSILPRFHGSGYAAEAARAMVDWAFAQGLHRVYARLEPRNTASARVLEKLGMRKEAHLVENEWVKGEWQSEAVYAILEREWQR